MAKVSEKTKLSSLIKKLVSEGKSVEECIKIALKTDLRKFKSFESNVEKATRFFHKKYSEKLSVSKSAETPAESATSDETSTDGKVAQ